MLPALFGGRRPPGGRPDPPEGGRLAGNPPGRYPPGMDAPDLDLSGLSPRLHVGTSSWSTDDWRGTLYDADARPADYITQYARALKTVEIDATFYRIPAATMVQGWRDKTPDEFLFSAKIPQVITHEKYLEGCEAEFTLFLERMAVLGPKLGPLIFQFPYFAKGKDAAEYETGADFRRRLAAFLPQLPEGFRFGVEIRNEKWLDDALLDQLRARGVALVLVEYYTMPPIQKLLSRCDPITADFAYVRFLGDHKKMDRLVAEREKPWGSLAVDRSAETNRWIPALRSFLARPLDVYAYFNNHFAGFAPGSIALFLRLMRET